jgi:hypothetical protein
MILGTPSLSRKRGTGHREDGPFRLSWKPSSANLRLAPESGEEFEALIKKAYATPKPIIERVGTIK